MTRIQVLLLFHERFLLLLVGILGRVRLIRGILDAERRWLDGVNRCRYHFRWWCQIRDWRRGLPWAKEFSHYFHEDPLKSQYSPCPTFCLQSHTQVVHKGNILRAATADRRRMLTMSFDLAVSRQSSRCIPPSPSPSPVIPCNNQLLRVTRSHLARQEERCTNSGGRGGEGEGEVRMGGKVGGESNNVKLRARSSHSHNAWKRCGRVVLITDKPDLHRYLHRYCAGRSVGRSAA